MRESKPIFRDSSLDEDVDADQSYAQDAVEENDHVHRRLLEDAIKHALRSTCDRRHHDDEDDNPGCDCRAADGLDCTCVLLPTVTPVRVICNVHDGGKADDEADCLDQEQRLFEEHPGDN